MTLSNHIDATLPHGAEQAGRPPGHSAATGQEPTTNHVAHPNPVRNNTIRYALFSAVAITTVIGGASFVLSFAALWDLATLAGMPRHLSWLWPVIVDGTILQATISVIALAPHSTERSGRRFFWTVLSVAAAVSIASNGLHAFIVHGSSLHPALAAAIATVAPISLLAATHGISVLTRVPRVTDATPPNHREHVLSSALLHQMTNGDEGHADERGVQAGIADREPTIDVGSLSAVDIDEAKTAVLDYSRRYWQGIADEMRYNDLTQRPTDEVAEMLRLKFEEERSYRQIGAQFGIHHSTVRRLISSAETILDKLRVAADAEALVLSSP